MPAGRRHRECCALQSGVGGGPRRGGMYGRGAVPTADARREELKAVWKEAQACTRCPQLASTPPERGVRRGQRRRRPHVHRRGARRQRGPPGAPVRRPGGPAARAAAGRDRPRARGRLHRQRPEVPSARQAGSAPAGDRQLPAVPLPAARPVAPGRLHFGNFSTKLLRDDPGTGITRLHGREEVRVIGPRAVRLYPIFHPPRRSTRPGCSRPCGPTSTRLPEACWRSTRRPSPSRRSPEPVVPSRWCPSGPARGGGGRAGRGAGRRPRPRERSARAVLIRIPARPAVAVRARGAPGLVPVLDGQRGALVFRQWPPMSR